MRLRKKLLVVALIIAIAVSFTAYAWANGLLPFRGSQVLGPDGVRDAAIEFIQESHPEMGVVDGVWSGGRVTPEGLVGHETYVYTNEGWKVTVEYNVVAPEHLTYEVVVEHNGLLWTGTVREGVVTETSCGETQYTEQQAVDAALNFLLNAPTFKWDGITESVKVLGAYRATHPIPTWIVQIKFTCAHGGYGDRTGQIVTQALTDHVTRITVQEGRILNAYIDDAWDEVNQKLISNAGTETGTAVPSDVTKFKAVVNGMRDVDVLVRVDISDGLTKEEAERIAEATFIQVMGERVTHRLDTLTFNDARIKAHCTWGVNENDMGHVFDMTADLTSLLITVTHCR